MSSEPGDEPMRRIAAVLSREEDVRLAIVFGSTVRGEPRMDSDVDVAILARAPLSARRRRELTILLADATGRPVDLVDLRTAGVVVTSRVLRYGKRVVSKDSRAFGDLLSRTLLDTADFLPYHERILAERRQAWTR
jgi:predicted nucleotidyltransferase